MDVLHSVAKGAIGAVPVVGSLATEIFPMVVTLPLEKRRAEWTNDIAVRLQALEGQGNIDPKTLKYNNQFIDVVLQTTAYPLKKSEKDKIDAFKNAVKGRFDSSLFHSTR